MTLVIGLLIPLLGTILGAAFVFLIKDEMSPRLQKTLLGFASGVMVAASVWSLLIPSMEMAGESNFQLSIVNCQLSINKSFACCRRFHVGYGIPADD